MKGINGLNNTGSLRINTRSTMPRTSSNTTFQEQFRSGLKSGIDLTNSALKNVAKPIPGSAALSASLSDAARNLSGGSRLDGGISSGGALDGDMNSLQDEMFKNNQDMLEQQVRVSQMTTVFNAKSNIIKAMYDALKNIGSNIR